VWAPRAAKRAAAATPPRIVRLPRWILARWIFTAIALIVAVAAPAGAATATPRAVSGGGIGIRLLDAPANAGNDPRARLYIVDHLVPGTVIHRRVEVSNTAASTMHIFLYPAAATIEKGSFLGAGGHIANDVSSWTSVDPSVSDVPAGGSLTAIVTIDVPHDAPPGEQYAVVWAEVRSAPVADGGIIQASRVGVRIYLSVGPGGAPAANFTIDSLTAERSPDGLPMVLATVTNTGGRALDMNGTLQLLAGPSGLSAGPFPASLGTTLAIGDTESVTIALDEKLPAGPWDARITLRSGLVERTARATITFPASGASRSVITSSVQPARLYAIAASLIILLLVGIATLLLLLKRRPKLVDDGAGGTPTPASLGVGKPVGLVR
jgi:hypothetical protein